MRSARGMSKVKIVVSAIASCCCITAALGYNWYCGNSDFPFDSEIWKQTANNDRLRMVHDLKHKLPGLRKADVEKLLGQPREDAMGNIYPAFDYIYPLGTKKRPFDEDGIWLLIKFTNDAVTDVEVRYGP